MLTAVSDIFRLTLRPQEGVATLHKRGRFTYAFFVVLVAGLLNGVSVFLWGTATSPLAEHIKQYAVVYLPLITVLVWLIFSLGLHFGARILKIRLPYVRVLTMLGYIFSVPLVASLILLPIGLLIWPKLPLQVSIQINSFLKVILTTFSAVLVVLGIKELGKASVLQGAIILITGFALCLGMLLGLVMIAVFLWLTLLGS